MYRKIHALGDVTFTAGSNAWTALPAIDLEDATNIWIAGSKTTGGAWTTNSTYVDLFGRLGPDSTGVKLWGENRSDNFYLSVRADAQAVKDTDLFIRTNGVSAGTVVNLVAVVEYE